MAARIDISEFRCFNQLVNGADFSANTGDFATTLVGNVGELVQVRYKATFNYSANASVGNQWSVRAGRITRTNGNFQTDDALVEGDVFLFFNDWANSDTATVEFTGTITGFSDGGQTVFFTVSGAQVTTGTQTNVGFICNPITTANRHTAMFLNFGTVANDDNYSNASLVTGSPQGYLVTGMAGITAPIAGEWLGSNLDAKTGSFFAYIATENTSDRSVTYQIIHEFVITPAYVVGQLTNLENNIAPALFAGAASLKYSFSLELRKAKTSTATAKTLVYNSLIGVVGWLNENFNGGIPDYSLDLVLYEDTATSDAVASLQTYAKTTATIVIQKASGNFTAGQRAGIMVQFLPDRLADYTGTTTDYTQNFLYDSLTAIEGTGDVVGTGIIKRLNVSNLGGGFLELVADIEYTQEQAVYAGDGNYLLCVNVANTALGSANSDRVMVIADVEQYTNALQAQVDSLINFDAPLFYEHDQVVGADTPTALATAWNEDGLVIECDFSLDLALLALLRSIDVKLVAQKTADGSYFELDNYTFNTSNATVSGGAQQINIAQTRNYALETGDQFNQATITTGVRVGDIQPYQIRIGQKVRWQDWIVNINADTAFFDSGEPNDNLNFKSSNYSDLLGYEIKAVVVASLTGVNEFAQAIEGTSQVASGIISVNDYDLDGNVSPAITATLYTLDPVTLADLDGQIYADRDTLFKAVWEAGSPFGSAVVSFAIHRIELTGDAGGQISELSSLILPPANNILKPLDGETLLNVALGTGADAGKLVTSCLIDYSRLARGNYNLSARLQQ